MELTEVSPPKSVLWGLVIATTLLLMAVIAHIFVEYKEEEELEEKIDKLAAKVSEQPAVVIDNGEDKTPKVVSLNDIVKDED